MEINDTMEFIQNVYDSYNISHSLVLYDKNEIMRCDIEDLYNKLLQNDFPVFELTHIPVELVSLENKHRMFILDNENFQEFIMEKKKDLSNISVIFCLSSILLHNTCEVLRKLKVNTSNSMHLFSC